MHTYGFTVTKDGTEKDLEQIDEHDYRKVWDTFAEINIMVAYKYKHEGDQEYKHIHYHGLIIIEKFLDYKEALCTGFSFRFDRIREQSHFDKLHNYCQHEMRDRALKLEHKDQELRNAIIYQRCMNAGAPMVQQKIKVKKSKDTLFKLVLTI